MEGQDLSIFFSEEAAKKLRVVLQCIFGCYFPSLCSTDVLGIENYPSASMSCYCDDLAQLLL